MKYVKSAAMLLSVLSIVACSSLEAASAKKDYSFYLAQNDSGFGQKNGTLDQGGYLNVTYQGETFTGRNANNVIEAKGNKGNKLVCSYEMPAETGIGNCKLSNGTVLKMKFE
ncbi:MULTISPECIES: hypothetical protein [Pectobacterium]|uniref:hypothetical protein n=1 Tax=Pectobacterium TaxID=122277 RepID=UPI0029DB91F6|nr:hypothetical protein [Pectobacterium carotovorum]MDX6914192.1 hypothetical protein [Pectobacterium carotovorum]